MSPPASSAKSLRVLFLDQGATSLGLIALGLLNMAARGRIQACNASMQPRAGLHPQAQALLDAYCIEGSKLASLPWQDFAAHDAEPHDIIIGLGEIKAQEISAWPGSPMFCQWPVHEPPTQCADEAEIHAAFARTFSELGRRIYIFAHLPFAELDTTRLQRELDALGDLSEIGK